MWESGLLKKENASVETESAAPVVWDYRTTLAVRFGKTVLRFRGEVRDGEMPSGTDTVLFDAEKFPNKLEIAARRP